jgi:hypothetical protein
MVEKFGQTRPFDKPGFEDLPIVPDFPKACGHAVSSWLVTSAQRQTEFVFCGSASLNVFAEISFMWLCSCHIQFSTLIALL